MAARCECCTGRDGRPRKAKIQTATGLTLVTAVLCTRCAASRHGRDRCNVVEHGKLCGELVWHCARVQHMGQMHPETLAKFTKVKVEVDEQAAKAAQPKYLGRIVLP